MNECRLSRFGSRVNQIEEKETTWKNGLGDG